MNMTSINRDKKILFWLLTVVVGIAPLFRGIFFPVENMFFGIAVAALVLFALYVDKKDPVTDQFPRDVMDYALLLLLAGYLMSTFTAIKPLSAVEMFLKIATVTMLYIVCKRVIRFNPIIFLTFIYIVGVIVAMIGLVGYAGFYLFQDIVLENRISSTFQYPNVLGTYLSVIALIGFSFAVTVKDKYKLPVAIGNSIILLALIGTVSRGALLVLPLAIIILVAGYHKNHRLRLFLTIVYNSVVSLVFGYLLSGASGSTAKVGLIVAAAMAVNSGVEYLMVRFRGTGKQSQVSGRKPVLIFGLIIVVLAGCAVILISTELPKERVLSRITDFSSTNLLGRVYYYQDAIKIIKVNPVLGVGGGGWDATYKQFQSYGYHSRQVHNFYLQTLVETGVLGLIAVLTLFAAIAQKGIRIFKSSDESTRTLGIVFFCGVFVIVIHSVIDFIMAYTAMAALLWVLLAGVTTLVRSNEQEDTKVAVKYSPPIRAFLICITALLVMLSSLSMFVSLNYETGATASLKSRNIEKMNEYLSKAAMFNPLRPQLYSWLARNNFNLGVESQDGSQIDRALEYANRAVALDRSNPEYHLVKADILFFKKEIEPAVKEVELAAELDPWDQNSFDTLVYTYATVGEFYVAANEREKANIYFEKALTVPVILKRKLDKLDQQKKVLWLSEGGTLPVVSDYMANNIKNAIKLKEQLAKL